MDKMQSERDEESTSAIIGSEVDEQQTTTQNETGEADPSCTVEGSAVVNMHHQQLTSARGIKRDLDELHSSSSDHEDMEDTKIGLKPGKKTRGRVKIKMEYIDNKLRRYTTFSKRKTGIMKKVSFSLSLQMYILLCSTVECQYFLLYIILKLRFSVIYS